MGVRESEDSSEVLSEPTEKKSGTCQSFWKSTEEIAKGSQRSPRRLGYSLKSSQVRELAGSPSEEVRWKARRNKTRRSRLKTCLGCVLLCSSLVIRIRIKR